MRSSFAVVIAVMLASSSAHADAWSVAKRVIPGGMTLASFNLGAIKKHAIGSSARKLFEEATSGIQRQFRDAQSQCSIDVWDRLSTAVVAFDIASEGGAAFVELRGVDRGSFMECLRRVDADPRKTVSSEGDIILVTKDGDIDLAVAWINGVLVVPFDGHNVESGKRGRARVQTMIGGGGVAKDAILIRALRDVDTSAAAWVVFGERLEWDGDDFDEPSRRKKDAAPITSLRRRDPFLLAEEGESDEGAGRRDDRKATLLYAVAQAKLGESTRLTAIGYFKNDPSWAASGLETELREERDLYEMLPGLRFTSTANRVQATVELGSSSLVQILSKLD